MMTAVASQHRARPWGGVLALCLLLVGLMLTLPAWAQQALPRIDSLLTDEAGALSVAERSEIGQRLTDIERRLGSQVLVLTVPTTAPESIEEYSMRVVENTPAGRKGIDDGVLILLAMKDRRMRIEVGYGLEGALPDAVAARIIRDQMTPHMRAGNVAAALTAAIDAVAARIAGEELPAPAAAPVARGVSQNADGRQSVDGFDFETFLIVALFMSFVLSRLFVSMLGRLPGAFATGGLLGFGGWLLTGSFFLALMAAVVGGVFTLMLGGGGGGGGRSSGGGGWPGGGGSSGGSRRRGGDFSWPSGGGWSSGGRRRGSRSGGGFSLPGGLGWPSGGGGGRSSGGGGGWSGGGGGGFGGGGASGSW